MRHIHLSRMRVVWAALYLIVSFLWLATWSTPADANIYSWVTRGGTRYYTNDVEEVPIEHRHENKLEVYSWAGVNGKKEYVLSKTEVPPRFRRQAGIKLLYKWVDKKKKEHFAFDLEDVPTRWRRAATKETGDVVTSAVVDTPTKEELASASAKPKKSVGAAKKRANPFVDAIKRNKQRPKKSSTVSRGAKKPQRSNPFVNAIKRAKAKRQQATQDLDTYDDEDYTTDEEATANPFLDAIRRSRERQ